MTGAALGRRTERGRGVGGRGVEDPLLLFFLSIETVLRRTQIATTFTWLTTKDHRMHITFMVIAFLVCVVNQPRRPPLLPPLLSVYTNSFSTFFFFPLSTSPSLTCICSFALGSCYWLYRLLSRGRLHLRISAGDDMPSPSSPGNAMGINQPYGAYMPSSSDWGQAVSP